MLNKPAILLVDDDPQVLAAVRRDLRSKFRDYTLVSASSGEQAVSTINELKSRGDALALVISDQRMPGLTGLEVCETILREDPTQRIVLFTAYADAELRRTARRLGVSAVLPKELVHRLPETLWGLAA